MTNEDDKRLHVRAALLRRLHRPGHPLVLPNAWDAASARLVEAEGFPVVATSSGAIAAALGYPDQNCIPPAEAFAAVERISRAVGVPVTADIEAGYGLRADEVVRNLIASGAVGCNLEDTDHEKEGELIDVETQARFLAAIRAAAEANAFDLVVNARVDVFRGTGPMRDVLDDGIRRAQIYVDAGADCVYPIRLHDEALIGEFVDAVRAPVNIMLTPQAPSLARLAELGVARVSLAGGLMRDACDAVRESLRRLRQDVDHLRMDDATTDRPTPNP